MVLVHDPEPQVRQCAAWALGQLGEDAPVDAGLQLVPLLEDPAPDVRNAVAQALGDVGMTGAVMALIVDQFRSGNSDLQSAAALALVNRAPGDVARRVVPVLPRAGAPLRKTLMAVLGEAGGTDARDLLTDHLRRDLDPSVRGEAAYRLGLLGYRESVDALQEASARDIDLGVRRWAAQAASLITSAGGPG